MRLFPPTWIGMTKLQKRDDFQEALILIFRKVFFQTIVWMHKAQRISTNHVNSCCIFYDILGLHAEVCNIKKLRGQPQTVCTADRRRLLGAEGETTCGGDEGRRSHWSGCL